MMSTLRHVHQAAVPRGLSLLRGFARGHQGRGLEGSRSFSSTSSFSSEEKKKKMGEEMPRPSEPKSSRMHPKHHDPNFGSETKVLVRCLETLKEDVEVVGTQLLSHVDEEKEQTQARLDRIHQAMSHLDKSINDGITAARVLRAGENIPAFRRIIGKVAGEKEDVYNMSSAQIYERNQKDKIFQSKMRGMLDRLAARLITEEDQVAQDGIYVHISKLCVEDRDQLVLIKAENLLGRGKDLRHIIAHTGAWCSEGSNVLTFDLYKAGSKEFAEWERFFEGSTKKTDVSNYIMEEAFNLPGVEGQIHMPFVLWETDKPKLSTLKSKSGVHSKDKKEAKKSTRGFDRRVGETAGRFLGESLDKMSQDEKFKAFVHSSGDRDDVTKSLINVFSRIAVCTIEKMLVSDPVPEKAVTVTTAESDVVVKPVSKTASIPITVSDPVVALALSPAPALSLAPVRVPDLSLIHEKPRIEAEVPFVRSFVTSTLFEIARGMKAIGTKIEQLAIAFDRNQE